MNPVRSATWFIVGVCLLSGCRLSATPVEDGAPPPSEEATTQIIGTATSEVSPGPTVSSEPLVSPSPSSTSATAALPVCREDARAKLEELTLAVVAEWDGDNEIYIIQGDGSNLTQLTFNDSGDVAPAWSPDGSRLVYIVDRYTEPRLFVSEADGLQGRIVAPELEVSSVEAVWSPGGDKLAFRSMDDLYVVDVTTGEAVNLTGTEDFALDTLRFSPDGNLVVFAANVLVGTPRHRLFVENVDGTSLRELSFPQGDVSRPTWHPFENRILFEGVGQAEGVGLYVASLDGSIERLPLEPQFRAPKPAWSPDGSMVGYIVGLSGFDSSGERISLNSLHIATATGEVDLVVLEPPDEPDIGLSIFEFVWAPDSRHVAYSISSESGGSGEVDLTVLDICDGSSSLVAVAIDAFSTPSWRPLR